MAGTRNENASSSKKACCMISEIFEEAGMDRAKMRQLRRQLLEGVMLLCQWQLERMDTSGGATAARKTRRVPVD